MVIVSKFSAVSAIQLANPRFRDFADRSSAIN